HVYSKSRLTLMIHYLRERSLPRSQYPIDYVTLFQLPEEDLKIIQQDYEKIITKIRDGCAHELSEGDTMYLGACTKGSTAAKSLMPQTFYAPYIKAPKRAFCLKQSYMTYILNKYVLNKIDTYESIVHSSEELEAQTFEELIKGKIRPHINKSVAELCKEFEIEQKGKKEAKNLYSMLAYRMLGIKSNKAEEFVKANIEVKAVRFEENNTITESTSFPAFSFTEFANEEWEDSAFNNLIGSKRFFFVVFKKIEDEYYLTGSQLWNLPVEDLEIVREGWEAIQKVVRDGVILTKKPIKNGTDFIVKNNFPKKSNNKIIHIRPHSDKRYYVLENGEIIGENYKDADFLPDGRMMTKQCFWLNNDYLQEVLTKLFD
ncbi:MAG: Sau3AI family type II restriction endonuclease, partial [Lysinibacillus sp.]